MPRLKQALEPFRPPFETARHYNFYKFRRDILAGMTVSVVEVPQSMAYALVAGVPPQYGIYTSVIQGTIGALLSSSEHMTTGPTNTQSLLIASAVSRMVNPTADPATYLRLVVALAMLKGFIQLAFAAARMGAMVRYVSRSVIVGLSAGAGVLIAFTQLPKVLGINILQTKPRLAGALGQLESLLPHLHEWHGKAILVATISLVIVAGVRLISRMLPGALLAIVTGAIIVAVMGWTANDLQLVGPLPRGFPTPAAPSISWAESESLFGGALALAVLGMLESVSIAKSIAAQTGERISANQEFFAQGLKNLISSFLHCMPGSGSFTRSALDHAAGAQTRFAAVFNAIFVGILFWALGAWAKLIPLASLGAVLMVIAYGLIDWGYLPRMLRASRSDALVCGITFIAAMIMPLEYAIFLGIFLNVGLYLRIASRLHVTELVASPGGPFVERPILDKRTGEKQVLFLQLEGDLFFAIADELQDRFAALLNDPPHIVILRLKRTHSIDGTVLSVLDKFVVDMRARGRYVLLCGVKMELMRVLKGYGLIDRIGRENVFETGGGVFTSAKQALNRARELAGRSIDTFGIDLSETEEIVYEI
jgi:SulP family sulfate permease